jgi:hypothetical protein
MGSAIAYTNLADSGLVFGFSSQETSLPASNVLVEHVARRWRAQANTGYFIIDLGSSRSIDTIAVMGMTMSASGNIQIRASNSDSTVTSSLDYDSGTMVVDNNYNSSVALITSPITTRWIRVDLQDTPSTYVEAGRIFVGLRQTFGYNFSYGWSRSWEDRSIRSKTRGGQTQVWLDNLYRVVEVTFNFLSTTERNSFVESIDLANGLHTDVLFITDTSSDNLARDSIWGLMTESQAVSQPYFDRFSKKYKIEERL